MRPRVEALLLHLYYAVGRSLKGDTTSKTTATTKEVLELLVLRMDVFLSIAITSFAALIFLLQNTQLATTFVCSWNGNRRLPGCRIQFMASLCADLVQRRAWCWEPSDFTLSDRACSLSLTHRNQVLLCVLATSAQRISRAASFVPLFRRTACPSCGLDEVGLSSLVTFISFRLRWSRIRFSSSVASHGFQHCRISS